MLLRDSDNGSHFLCLANCKVCFDYLINQFNSECYILDHSQIYLECLRNASLTRHIHEYTIYQLIPHTNNYKSISITD